MLVKSKFRRGIAPLFAVLVLITQPILASAAGISSLPDTLARVKPSVVAIGTYQHTRAPRAIFRGTGFVIGDGTLIVTNAHVLPDVVDYKNREQLGLFYRSGDNSQFRSLKKIAVDEDHDLALLKLSGKPLPALKLGNTNKVREGALYAFTGYPIGMVLGLHPVTHRGIVSAISPIAIPAPRAGQLNPKLIRRLKQSYPVFQLDATAYPGNSGSPLYEIETGRVIGIVNKVFVKESKESVIQKPSGISYAIPVTYIKMLLKQVK